MNRRIQWLDFAKGFTILFVVISHALSFSNNSNNVNIITIINYCLCIFIMPVFFAVSGYLYKSINSKHDYKILLYKKLFGFLLPYIIFTIISVFGQSVTHGFSIYRFHFIFLIIRSFLMPVGSNYLWFIYALFIIFVIVGFMDCLCISFNIQLLIVLILLMFECTFNFKSNSYFVFGYFSCFYVGRSIKKFHLLRYLKKKYFFYVLTITEIILLILQYISNPYINTDSFNYYDLVTKNLSVYVFFGIFISFDRMSILFKYLDKYGRYTLIIYLVHIPIIFVTSYLINLFSINGSFLPIIINTSLAWYISILIVNVSKKIRFIRFLFYPRKYLDKIYLN